ncbi:SDR family oxidoreductase [Hydrogenophaga sp. 5NK40-0174]|uniref:SDR family oxidoreductase n=1 Tax=Hydrogenophaga sp. 5NK40-0174 TaxID=3127649 RepID=UPI0031059DD6
MAVTTHMPLGALPSRFRRQRLLIVGCGDVGLRVAAIASRFGGRRVLTLTSSPERVDSLRAAGLEPLLGNLDVPASLRRLAGLGTRILHLAPPPADDRSAIHDPRTRALTRALVRRSRPASAVYGSTSGVYGDRQGQWLAETASCQPQTPRGHRRVDAENHWHGFGLRAGVSTRVLRIPGIYANDRAGGTPRERLLKGTPVLAQADDVYTNHIHADDLARACWLALWRGGAQRNFHVTDDTEMKMGDYFDAAADLYGLQRPPRVSRKEAVNAVSPMQLSFMSESRRLRNQRMKNELGLRLVYPTVIDGLKQG